MRFNELLGRYIVACIVGELIAILICAVTGVMPITEISFGSVLFALLVMTWVTTGYCVVGLFPIAVATYLMQRLSAPPFVVALIAGVSGGWLGSIMMPLKDGAAGGAIFGSSVALCWAWQITSRPKLDMDF